MSPAPPPPELHLHHLRAIKLLGTGATGTVFLVHNHITDPSAHSPFALKTIEKKYCTTDSTGLSSTVRRARWELSVLHRVNNKKVHDFLPLLLGTFETDEIIAWATPYCPGGDLNILRQQQTDGVFSPSVIRFYLAEIVCALEHIHNMGIVYRDLKPENILIQNSGHVTLTDFDLSRALAAKSLKSLMRVTEPEGVTVKLRKAKSARVARVSPLTRQRDRERERERSNSFVGTDEYLAPEVVRGDGHEFAVDWWALGILAYEMLYGTTPFRGKNRKDTFARILMMPLKFNGKVTSLTDLITKLLEKDPTRRLGYSEGACEIREHPFFDGLQWGMLTKVVRPPFIPSSDDVDVKSKDSKLGGFSIIEYFQKRRQLSSSLESPSRDDGGYSVSFKEF